MLDALVVFAGVVLGCCLYGFGHPALGAMAAMAGAVMLMRLHIRRD